MINTLLCTTTGGTLILNQSTQTYECKCPQGYINKNGQCIQNSQHQTSSFVPKYIS